MKPFEKSFWLLSPPDAVVKCCEEQLSLGFSFASINFILKSFVSEYVRQDYIRR